MKQPGSTSLFTGGPGAIPKVTVDKYPVPGKHFGKPTLRIQQGMSAVILAPEQVQEILDWYKSVDSHS